MGVTSTGVVVDRSTASVVQPKKRFATPLRPCELMTIRSA
jgi:hypothetical protein